MFGAQVCIMTYPASPAIAATKCWLPEADLNRYSWTLNLDLWGGGGGGGRSATGLQGSLFLDFYHKWGGFLAPV